MKVSIDEIQVLEEVYPRDSFDNETVNNYCMNVDKLPPIVVSNEKILIDGYHRLLAHKLAEKMDIEAEFMDVPRDRILWEATRLNSRHGKQLSRAEKRRLSRHFYENNGCTQQAISDVLAVSPSTVSNWLTDLVQQAKEEQKRQITDLYLRCLTQREIADKIGYSQRGVSETIQKVKSELLDNPIVPESRQLFNVWNFSGREKKYGLDCKGKIPGQIIENILYYYTAPFDIVVDPMVGGGTTIDVCKVMYRRYRAYDIKPLRDDIASHDIRNGFPDECKNCDLIFLDPPYYNGMDDEAECFKDLGEFYQFIGQLAKNSFKAIRENGIVSLLMLSRDNKGHDTLSVKCAKIFLDTKFDCIDHISSPLTTQSASAQEVVTAKKNRRLLGRNRDLYIFVRRN